MNKEEYLIQLSNNFYVEINGLLSAEGELEKLKSKWLLIFEGKTKKEFYEKIIPKLEKLKDKFNKELAKTLKEVQDSK